MRLEAVRIAEDGSASVGEFKYRGPIEGTFRDFPHPITKLAVDSRGPTYYGLGDNSLYAFDRDCRNIRNLNVPDELTPGATLSAIAFDDARQRLLLATVEGETRLYAYSPEGSNWTVLRDRDFAVAALAYDGEDDLIYALSLPDAGHGGLTHLLTFDPAGAPLDEKRISEWVPAFGDYQRTQMGYVPRLKALFILQGPFRPEYKPGSSPGDQIRYALGVRDGQCIISTYLDPRSLPDNRGPVE